MIITKQKRKNSKNFFKTNSRYSYRMFKPMPSKNKFFNKTNLLKK